MPRASRRTRADSASPEAPEDGGGDADAGVGGRRSKRTRTRTAFFEAAKGEEREISGDDDGEAEVDGDDGEAEVDGDGGDDSEVEVVAEAPASARVRRKSSRSTAFRGGMADPSSSIADLLKPITPAGKGKGDRQRRGARAGRSSLERESEEESEEEEDAFASPVKQAPRRNKAKAKAKSPATRHSRRRLSKKPEYQQSSSEDEFLASDPEEDDEQSEAEEEEDEIKINKIVACQSLPLKEWDALCKKMNTTEITNGSRWLQDAVDADDNRDRYEERYLIKWDNLSYLHCSWETEPDLVELCDGARTRLGTFFRKAQGGLLFGQDERLDGVSSGRVEEGGSLVATIV